MAGGAVQVSRSGRRFAMTVGPAVGARARRRMQRAMIGGFLLVVGAVLGEPGGAADGGGAGKGPSPAIREASAEQRSFIVYDAISYPGKPDLTKYGLKPVKALYEGLGYWRKTGPGVRDVDRSWPDEAAVRKLGRDLAREHVEIAFVDIEHWPLTGSDAVVRETIEKYRRILEWLRAESPGTRLGCYGVPPVRNYWAPVRGPGKPDYVRWEADNRRLAPIAERSDVLFPSLYTFYGDQAAWVKYAEGNLKEARKYRKPVYAFLYPQYADESLRAPFLTAEYWRRQLETSHKWADGVVIWGAGPAWAAEAPWWTETLKFMRAKGLRQDVAAGERAEARLPW